MGTDFIHEALMDEANRRDFLAVVTQHNLISLTVGLLPLSNEEIIVGLCRPIALKSLRSLILAFQMIAHGSVRPLSNFWLYPENLHKCSNSA